jgi:hypothetical protein
MNINGSYKQLIHKKTLEDKMRILANFLIDKFLEDRKNNDLQTIKNSFNLKKDFQINNGTLI